MYGAGSMEGFSRPGELSDLEDAISMLVQDAASPTESGLCLANGRQRFENV